MQEHNRRKPLT